MTKFKCFVLLGLFVSVHSASIYSKSVDIPVEVVYSEEIPYESHYIAPSENSAARRNLNEKIQLSPTELRQLLQLEDNSNHGNPNSIKNLNEKIQLSPDDLLQAEKHLPLDQEISVDLKSNAVEENSNVNADSISNQDISTEENKKPENNLKPTESSKPDETVFVSLGESSTQKDASTEPSVPVSSTTEENLPDSNLVLLIQIAQNIVSTGLTDIRENIDNLGTTEDGSNKNPPITAQQWDRLNQTITNFFTSLLERGTVKGSNEVVLHNIVLGVRGVTNKFVESLRSEATNTTQPLTNATQPSTNGTQPQRPGVGQNIINLITAGLQGITTSLNDIRNRATTASTILGEKDQPTTAPPGPFQNIVNQFGEAINNLNPFTQSPTAAPGAQGDVGTTPQSPFQNFANQVGQVINNLNPLNQGSTQAPGAQNEGTTQSGPIQAVQNVFNQFGQAVNNIFNQGSTAAPGSQNEGSTPAGPIQQAIQNVVSVFGNLNPLNPSSTAGPGSQNEESTTQGGPLQGAQNFINQVGQGVQNAFNQIGQAASTLNPINQGSTAAPGNNPLQGVQQGVQNAIDQVSQAASTLNPLNQGSTSSGNNPLQGVQNAINQVASTLNPLNQGSTSGNNPLQGIQNAVNQVGQVASTFNPLNQGSTAAPGSNPLQGVQSAINQVGQAINPGANSADAVETVQSIGSEINLEKKPNSEEKAKDTFSDQEIMVAMD